MSKVQAGMETRVASGNNENQIREEWGNKLADLAIDTAQFYAMTKKQPGGSQGTGNRTFQWSEYDENDPKINVPTGTTVADNKITLPNTADLHGLVKDTILIDKNGVYYRTTSNPTANGNNIDINLIKIKTSDAVDGFSTSEETAAQATLTSALNGDLYMLYVNKESGSDDINPVARILDNTRNVIGIFEDYSKIDRTRATEKTRTGTNLRDFNLGKNGIKHARDIERSMWFGLGYDNNVNRQATKGFLNFSNIQTLSTALSGFSYLDLVEFAEQKTMFRNKKLEINGYCNPAFLTAIIRMLTVEEAKMMIQFDAQGRKNEFGMNVRTLVTPHVTYNLTVSDALKERFGAVPVMACIDMAKVAVRHLEGNGLSWDTHVERDVQQKHSNNFIDKIYTIGGGLHLENAQCHSFLKLV